MRYLTNDKIFECVVCEEVFKVYSTSGETNYCPSCGTREIDFKECKEKIII